MSRWKNLSAVAISTTMFSVLLASGAQAVPQDAGASTQAVKRASIKCTKPAGKVTNYSWGDGSYDSVTVYFNNHCSHKVGAKLHFQAGGGQKTTRCLTTNGGTKGKKKFSVTRYHLKKITKGC
ncbi:hypothetical protein [Streptomyces sp. NBC_01257]|uniref:hypothetical protein n=1 Tax=Streptomyces sp. NBC_01257 TaxID=2903799 RepID=UPI002DDB8822|nr:hypothetical protein [Streptomyces sp. NBC_01257]WRZ67378.1 hypothetical protein OG408_27405 [Streptomyces sp. NBC_01257]